MYTMTRQKRHTIRNHRKSNGLTLIELMIAMLLSMILLAVISLFFLNSMKSQKAISIHSELNQNNRLALNLMTRALSSAGYSNGVPLSNISGINLTISGNNCEDLAAANSMQAVIMAGRSTSNNILGCITDALPGNYSREDGSPSDWLLFKAAAGPVIPVGDLEDDTSYMISTAIEGALFSGKNPPGTIIEGIIHEYRFGLFYLNTQSQLVMLELNGNTLTPRVIASGISQMKLRLGLATSANERSISEWVGAPLPTDPKNIEYWSRVRAVEINLLARGREDAQFKDTKDYHLGHITVKGKDNKSRGSLMTETVYLYNQSFRQTL